MLGAKVEDAENCQPEWKGVLKRAILHSCKSQIYGCRVENRSNGNAY